MATAMNCSVKTYKGVPLIKGGTEVLYLSQGSAEGVLGAFLHKTYTKYYYTRENVGAIQVEDTIPNLEGCNYVSFQNLSHGGKIFFGFIDQLVYINDNNTEIRFTIDIFPTYLGDTKQAKDVYVIRNTPLTDSDQYIAEDYDFQGRVYTYNSIGHIDLPLAKTITIFTGGKLVNEEGVVIADTDTLGAVPLNLYGFNTGLLYIENMTPAQVKLVTQAGGSIIGVYAVDGAFNAQSAISNDVSATVSFSGRHLKLKDGQYNKISLVCAGKSRSYNLDKFNDRNNLIFRVKRFVSPTPVMAIYPLGYEGLAENTAEALVVEYPMLATSTSNYYSSSTAIENLKTSIMALATQAGKSDAVRNILSRGSEVSFPNLGMSGQHVSEVPFYNTARPLAGFVGASELLANMGSVLKSNLGSMNDGEINTSAGGLVLTNNNAISIDVIQASHSVGDVFALDDYFDYFGYSFNEFREPNLNDKSYLQIGSPFLLGSEVDYQLNSRIMNGIKIRKTLS